MNKAMSDINERTRLDGNAPNSRLAHVKSVGTDAYIANVCCRRTG